MVVVSEQAVRALVNKGCRLTVLGNHWLEQQHRCRQTIHHIKNSLKGFVGVLGVEEEC